MRPIPPPVSLSLPSRLLAASLLSAALSAQSAWVVGEPVPELKLPTIDGRETVALSSLRGQRLLLIEFGSASGLRKDWIVGAAGFAAVAGMAFALALLG